MNIFIVDHFKEFVALGTKMRIAQKQYFELRGKASKMKTPDAHKAAKDMLYIAKELEKQFDEATKKYSSDEVGNSQA